MDGLCELYPILLGNFLIFVTLQSLLATFSFVAASTHNTTLEMKMLKRMKFVY